MRQYPSLMSSFMKTHGPSSWGLVAIAWIRRGRAWPSCDIELSGGSGGSEESLTEGQSLPSIVNMKDRSKIIR